MDAKQTLALFISAVIVAMIRTAPREFRAWQSRRETMSEEARNVGFWTDDRVDRVGRYSGLLWRLIIFVALAPLVWGVLFVAWEIWG